MSQHLVPNGVYTECKGGKLPAVLAGDVAAATISATAISPILTVIDRKVVFDYSIDARCLTFLQSCR